jgi:hypothetical protein
MKYEYLLVSYRQEKTAYRFYVDFKEVGITVRTADDILPILNHYGSEGWEFICWDNGRMVFKRSLFICELRLVSGEETITTINFRSLPRVGEYISTTLEHDGKLHQFLIKGIWNWVADEKEGHKFIIYVTHV